MPRVKFLADFDWKPTSQTTIAYRAGQVVLVTTPCAEKAVALDKAERVDLPAPDAGVAATIAKKTRRRKFHA